MKYTLIPLALLIAACLTGCSTTEAPTAFDDAIDSLIVNTASSISTETNPTSK